MAKCPKCQGPAINVLASLKEYLADDCAIQDLEWGYLDPF